MTMAGVRMMRLMSGVAVCSVLGAAPLAAQDAGQTTVLEQIVVRGAADGETAREKLGKGAADTPLASGVSGEEIRKNDIDSIADLGRSEEPGVIFDKARGGLFIRGLGGPRVSTTIDGIPIPYLEDSARSGGPTGDTNADGGVDSFDFSSLSALDVMRGADSSRAGSGALAGGLVLQTLEPEDLIEDGRNWGALTKTTYDGSDASVSGSAAAAMRAGATSMLFQGGYKRGNETINQGNVATLGPTRTDANPADYDQNNLLFKLRQQIEGGPTIGFTAERFDNQRETQLLTRQGATSGSSRAYRGLVGHDDTRRERVSFDYVYDPDDSGRLIRGARATAYWQRLSKTAGNSGTRLNVGSLSPFLGGVVIPESPWQRSNEIEDARFGFTGSLLAGFETGQFDHEVSLGLDASTGKVKQFAGGVDACTLGILTTIYCNFLHSNQADIPNVKTNQIGFYIQDEIRVGDSRLSITPGIRFDWFDYAPEDSATYAGNAGYGIFGVPVGKSDYQFSPKLLAEYELNATTELFAQWSMAFRAPTVDELYLNFANPGSGYAVIGNPALEPETGHGFEVGATYDDGSLSGKITGFYNIYRNFIDDRNLTPAQIAALGLNPATFPAFLQQSYNRARVHVYGVELSAEKRFDNGFNLHGGFAYTNGSDQDTGEHIRTIAPFKLVAGAGYEGDNWGVDVTNIYSAGMKNDNNPNTFDAPDYFITDLTAWWEPTRIEGLRLQAGVYNLFDETYYNAVALNDYDAGTAPSNSNSLQPVAFFSEPGRHFKVSLTKKF